MIKKLSISLLLIVMFSSCATMFCTLMCDEDQDCYTTCRYTVDVLEEDYQDE